MNVPQLPQARHSALYLYGATAVVLLLIAASVVWLLAAEHKRIEQAEHRSLESKARVISANMLQQLHGTSEALRRLRDRSISKQLDRAGSEAAGEQLRILATAMPGVRTLVVSDAAATVVQSSRKELLGISIAEREYFQTARAGANPDVLYVSPPYTTVLGALGINVTYVMLAADGGFAGLILATLDPEYFRVLLASVLETPDMRSTLAHADGTVFVFVPHGEQASGFRMSDTMLRLDSNRPLEVFTDASFVKGEPRLIARVLVQDTRLRMDRPLIVTVSRPVDAIYAPWWEQLWAYGLMYVLFAVTLITAMRVYLQHQRRVQELQAQFYAQEHVAAERLELVLTGADLGLWDWHVPSGRVVFNKRWCTMLGHTFDEVAPVLDSWKSRVRPEDWPVVNAALEPHLQGKTPFYECEYAIRHKDGHWVWVFDRGRVMERDARGAAVRVLGTFMDITERRGTREEVLRLGRYYAALSKTNETIIRAHSADDVLCSVCRIAVEYGGLALVWVGRHEPRQQKMGVQAVAGAAREYLDNISLEVDVDEPIAGEPFGLALRERKPCVVNNLLDDPALIRWRSQAQAAGLRALLVCPVVQHGVAWGTIAFYASEENYFNKDLIALLTELTADVAFCLEGLDREQSRREMEARLLLTARMLEASHEGVFITDAENRYTMVNPAFCGITGYTEAELLGKSPSLLKSGRQDEAFYRDLWASVTQRGYWQGEIWDRRKSGEVFPAALSITAVRDAQLGIQHHIGVFSDISQRKAVQERIEHLAQHDLLTGLPNRALLSDRMQVAMAQSRRHARRLALLFVDLDRFKLVNDSLGHAVGDILLRTVAERINTAVRASDTVSRFGGDEFVVLLGEIDAAEDAARVAAKIISEVSAPYQIEGHELLLAASVGIAVYPDNADDTMTLTSQADTAMMAAKQAGGRQYQFYSEEMGAAARERLNLERDLRGAAARGEIFLAYQPQWALGDGRLVGAEALVRWRHPERGLISPASFIRVAEESGLILDLGIWIMREACRQALAWRRADVFAAPVSVNVSAAQFRQPDFVATVRQVLDETGLPAAALELEVTESVVMENIEAVIAKLSELEQMGVMLAIDDFGTGYSSLTYLQRLPAHRLKIDQSFVRELPANTDAVAIARAIVSMGHALEMRVIAEGVETTEQAEFLRDLGCEDGQGYVCAKPMAAPEFAQWVAARKAG